MFMDILLCLISTRFFSSGRIPSCKNAPGGFAVSIFPPGPPLWSSGQSS
jgi:hypothetical protein